jgi:hypothetical protein
MAAEESAHLSALSEWLQLMLAEIARKREDLESARAEEAQRLRESEAARQRAGQGAAENPTTR